MKIVKIITKIILCLLELLGAYFFFTALDFADEKMMAGVLLGTALIMALVSGGTVYFVIRNRQKIFRKSVLFNIGIFLTGFGISFLDPSYDDGIYAAVLFWIVGAIVFIILGISSYRISKPAAKPYVPPKRSFEPYKSKWVWDHAAEEYIDRFGIDSVDNLSDEQNDKIYEYASMPVIYLLEWLARNDFLCDELSENAAKVRNGEITILELFRDRDYVLLEEDIRPELIPFLNTYFLDVDSNWLYGLESTRFFFDYYEVIDNPKGYVYCVDYSSDDYIKIASMIDKRFGKYKGDLDGWLYLEDDGSEATWKRFGQTLMIKRYWDNANPYDDKLVNRCDDALNSLSDNVIYEMLDDFAKQWDISELVETSDNQLSVEEKYSQIISQIRFEELVIFPEDKTKELGYAVTGSADFEEEHGISVTFRGNKLVNIGYQADYINPYSAEADELLELKNNLEELQSYDLNSADVVNELTAKNSILGTIEIEGMAVCMTKSAIRDIKACESKLRTLQAFGVINRTQYEKAYDDISTIIPKRIVIRGFLDDKRVFAHSISNWR